MPVKNTRFIIKALLLSLLAALLSIGYMELASLYTDNGIVLVFPQVIPWTVLMLLLFCEKGKNKALAILGFIPVALVVMAIASMLSYLASIFILMIFGNFYMALALSVPIVLAMCITSLLFTLRFRVPFKKFPLLFFLSFIINCILFGLLTFVAAPNAFINTHNLGYYAAFTILLHWVMTLLVIFFLDDSPGSAVAATEEEVISA